MKDEFIERRIVTGLIVSTDYILRIRKVWNDRLLESQMARRLSGWCLDFFDKYKEAPGEEIESIFHKKGKNLKKEEVNDIEDIIADLSDEYERKDKFNVPYLFDQTVKYFEERNLTSFVDEIKELIDEGEITNAKKAALEYHNPISISNNDLDFSKPELIEAMQQAFKELSKPLFILPRQLGDFLNEYLVRGGFVAFMGAEKMGKTWWFYHLVKVAVSQGLNVAFFQAGDMSQSEQLIRVGINLTKKSNKEQYCEAHYEPVRDCILNQLDQCDLRQRECDFGIFDDKDREYIRKRVTLFDLESQYKDNPSYKPCWNCSKYWKKKLGAVWIKPIKKVNPLNVNEATKAATDFFIKKNRRLKMSTYPNSTLTMTEVDNKLDIWEREDGFIADLIVLDYMDIMAAEESGDFRHQENEKWKKARGLSQKRKSLVIAGTQTDADSYKKDRVDKSNFSEDKRKYGHVTAMFGLNRDKNDREKAIGIMRLNRIVIREGACLSDEEVYVLQNLRRGQPCLQSYW
jgi:DNA-directed RNA polymerase subunit F